MATLTIPHSFTAGTPALASEVNANFQAIVTWTQSNIGTDNLGVLGARSSALPSGPANAILSVQQTSSNPAIYLSNSGSDFSLQIQQGGLLATNKSIVSITDSFNQTASGAAHMRMTLSNSTNIPALEIVHGVQNTFKVQRTGISTDVNITTAGNIGVATVNATTVNATTVNATDVNTTGKVTATAPVSDALAIKVKGRSSDNTAVVQFKSNDDATVYASVNSSTSGLGLNLPDTADNYNFQVNGITKAVINNTGIDGQYVYNLPESALPTRATINYSWGSSYQIQFYGGWKTVYSTTFSTTTANKLAYAQITSGYLYSLSVPNTRIRIFIDGIEVPIVYLYNYTTGGGFGSIDSVPITTLTPAPTPVLIPNVGTHTIEFKAYHDILTYLWTNGGWTAGTAFMVLI